MKRLLLIMTFCLTTTQIHSQQNARNGYTYAPTGEIRLFIVFADVVNDTFSGTIPHWQPGCLPEYADEIIDDNNQGSLLSYISRYYDELSFGTFRITGDYYPHLLEFNSSEIQNNGFNQVVNYLNNLSGNDIATKNGHFLSDFDRWSFSSPREYYPKQQIPDNLIDMMVIIWRRNSKYRSKRDGGSCIPGNTAIQIKNFSGVNGYAILYSDDASGVLRHEFGHALIGHNSYHTGGAGTSASGHFLPSVGGYSILSSHNHNLESCNGWDRWRLGWKRPEKVYEISALNTDGSEANTDIVYNQSLQAREYILRDFATYGDVVRIKLPYLNDENTQIRNQYLWIENHQIKNTSIEFGDNRPKGIRFNIQVGNDELNNHLGNSRTNYIVPLSSFGNHDFYFDTMNVPDPNKYTNYYRAFAYKSTSNPFCGYHPAMMPAIDFDGDDEIKPKEFVVIWKLFFENILKVNSWTVYGNDYDAFRVGSKISIYSNPPTTPLMTYRTGVRPTGNGLGDIYPTPAPDDNRNIWLNGLSVEILDEFSNGDIKIRICFNDYKVKSNVRWCGPIMHSERVELQPSCIIDLDYGLSPTRPNNPSFVNGENVFASPTSFICRNNSFFKQESASTVNVKNLSALVLESGSLYEIEDGAVLNINSSGTLHVKSGATLRVKNTGHVEIQRGAYICIEDGANIELVDELSAINLRQGHQLGLNPETFSEQSNCTTTPLTNFPLVTGSNGHFHVFGGNRFIQDTTYYGNAYEVGNTIRAGYNVTLLKSPGDVIFESGSHVIMDAEDDVLLKSGVKVKQGAILEVR